MPHVVKKLLKSRMFWCLILLLIPIGALEACSRIEDPIYDSDGWLRFLSRAWQAVFLVPAVFCAIGTAVMAVIFAVTRKREFMEEGLCVRCGKDLTCSTPRECPKCRSEVSKEAALELRRIRRKRREISGLPAHL